MSITADAQPGEARTVAECVDWHTRAGYTDWFKASPNGLSATQAKCLHQPETMRVHRIVRFEGVTDPDDEAIVFALECEHGVRGTYTAPYGPRIPDVDADIVRRLRGRGV